MEETFSNSRETRSGLLTVGELETEKSSREVAFCEFPAALARVTQY